MTWDACIEAPFGRLGVRVRDGHVVRIEYLPPGDERVEPTDPLARETCRQLRRYLEDPAAPFDLPIAPEGTDFRQRVWRALMQIPVGTVITYGELAKRLGTSPRPIGGACGSNPVPPVVPCHRIVAAHGLGGFMGAVDGHPLAVKQWLLKHEGVLP
ncbi:MAG: methylated-DNA--[protein]-cysteine S-methyltransferase [Burkholderiales bacterium]